MKKIVLIITVGFFLFAGISGAFCAPRGGHSFHYYGGPRVFIDGHIGLPYYYPYGYDPYYPYSYPHPYYYPYSYPYPYEPYSYSQPPEYNESEQDYYWYYCKNPEGYYPYVTSCPGGWIKVAPTPSQPGKEEEKVK